MRVLHADSAVFDEFPSWLTELFAHYDAKQSVYLHVDSDDPDLFAGADTDRLRRETISRGRALKKSPRHCTRYKCEYKQQNKRLLKEAPCLSSSWNFSRLSSSFDPSC